MEVDATDIARYLVEADVVKSFEAGSRDGADAVVRHQEVLLPPHKNILPLREILVCKIRPLCISSHWPPCIEPIPVLHVDLVVRAPIWVLRLERIFIPDYLAFEVCRERRVVIRQTCIVPSAGMYVTQPTRDLTLDA